MCARREVGFRREKKEVHHEQHHQENRAGRAGRDDRLVHVRVLLHEDARKRLCGRTRWLCSSPRSDLAWTPGTVNRAGFGNKTILRYCNT